MLDIPEAFFQEEIRDGYLVSEMMKRSWAAQLSILDSLKKLFEKYDLQYFAGYGSLLGAVRHGGYIPWDDDLDIVMPRKDFMILLEHADEIEDGLLIRSFYNSDSYMNFNAVATHKADVLRWDDDRFDRYYGCPFICYVDIFPWDYVPGDKELLTKQKGLFVFAYKLIYDLRDIEKSMNEGRLLSLNDIRTMKSGKAEAVNDFLNNFEKLKSLFDISAHDAFSIDPSAKLRQQLCIMADKAAQMCEEKDAEYIGYYPFFANKQSFQATIKKEWIKSTTSLPFEFENIEAPGESHKVLESEFGKDYMTPVLFASDHNYPFFRNEIRVLINGDVGEMLSDMPTCEPSVDNIPEEIKRLLVKDDGSLKKIVMFGLSATDIINRGQAGIGKITAVLDEKSHDDTVVFVFVPAGLKDFLEKCNLKMYRDYCQMLEQVEVMENVILDADPPTEMLWTLIFICDEYYGDDCRLTEICRKYEIPVIESIGISE